MPAAKRLGHAGRVPAAWRSLAEPNRLGGHIQEQGDAASARSLRERTSNCTMEGAELTTACGHARSDPRAFARLVDRFHVGVHDYLCWLTRDTSLAADLTEETFLSIWQHPPDPRRPASLRAWVFRIALNAYRQHVRRRGPQICPLDDAEAVPDPSAEPLAALTRDEMRHAIRDAVLQLPEPYREVIALHNLEGLTLREASGVLDIPIGTVKSRLSTAFAMLRRSLREWKEDGDELP